jgi:hypothetical protein
MLIYRGLENSSWAVTIETLAANSPETSNAGYDKLLFRRKHRRKCPETEPTMT